MPSGRLAGSSRAPRQRRQGDARGRCPAPRNRPSAKTSSPSDACKRWAASVRAFASVASIALHDGRAAHVHGARAAMARAALHLAGVGLDVAERLDRHAQPVGRDLGEGGLVALAVGLRADRDHDPAVALEAHLGALVGRAARGFEEAGDADAAQPPARLGRRAPRGEAAWRRRAPRRHRDWRRSRPNRSPCRAPSCAGTTRSGSAGAARRDRGRACAPPPRWRAR